MKPRIAHIAGSNATISNTPALVTSNKARERHGLPLLRDESGQPLRYDALRAQRLAAPVKLYIEQFSAHPLESDAAELYGPADGYLDGAGNFHRNRTSERDVPVYEVTLEPRDGLYPLPYMARQADGRAWDDDGGERLFEEIDRFGLNDHGRSSLLASRADFDFFRVTPPAGYTKADPPEVRGRD